MTVQFGAESYSVAEGESRVVEVRLSADPERTVVIPVTTADQGGVTADDYSGVPSSVTFDAGDTIGSFTFTASEDEDADTGESVLLGFGTMPDARVSAGTPAETTVTIRQTTGTFDLDCIASVWCADLGFEDWSAADWGWFWLTTSGYHYTLSDTLFTFRGVEYAVRAVEQDGGAYPVLPNSWSREEQNLSTFRFTVQTRSGYAAPSLEHYKDWVLHVDGVQLPFGAAISKGGESFAWVDPNIQEAYNEWTPTTINKLGIEEVAASDLLDPALPRPPRVVRAYTAGAHAINVRWLPADYLYDMPAPTGYVVQWKPAEASWDNAAQVREREVPHGNGGHHTSISGLSYNVLYSVRAYAYNDAGNGVVSDESLARTQDSGPRLAATTVNGATLTLNYNQELDASATPPVGSFVVLADAGIVEVSSVLVSGRDVVLTLAEPVSAHNSVRAQYVQPDVTDGVFLRNQAGNFVQEPRANDGVPRAVNITPLADTPPLTAAFTNLPVSHDGSAAFTFNVEFSEKIWISTGLPEDDLLVVEGGDVLTAVRVDRLSNLWAVTIQPGTRGDVVITLPTRTCQPQPYSDPAGAPCGASLFKEVARSLTNEPTATIPGRTRRNYRPSRTPRPRVPRASRAAPRWGRRFR